VSRRPARFTPSDITRALKGAADAGVSVAVLIQPDGAMAIVPADRMNVSVVANDLDARVEKFGGR
jgi:hypothetical protein